MNRHLQNLVLGGNQQSLEPTIKSMAKILGQTQRNVVSHVGIFYFLSLLSSRYLRPICLFKRRSTQYFLSEQFDNSAQSCLAFLMTLSDLTFKHMILPIKAKMNFHLLYIAIYQMFSKLPSERQSIHLTCSNLLEDLALDLHSKCHSTQTLFTYNQSDIAKMPIFMSFLLMINKCFRF